MRRRFNVTGSCSPDRHYMIRLDDRLKKIKENYVDYGSYFVINRGRQYGKTTTLRALKRYLSNEYLVASLDFQELSTGNFADESTFTRAFAKVFTRSFKTSGLSDSRALLEPVAEFTEKKDSSLNDLFDCLSCLCENSPRPIILMIDEVDSASNNQVFIEFLALLRKYYLNRDETPIFQSVVLAGVYDIKNLKLKLRPELEHQYNSPWNIAAKFNIDMSFSADRIASMLEEYEADYHTGMDIQRIAEEIYQYTSGYPVLVSSICKYIDEYLPDEDGFKDLSEAWTKEGIARAVKMLLKENTPLFDSMVKQLDVYKDMREMIEQILYQGRKVSFSPAVKSINLGLMFGFLKEENGHVAVANRIFEMYLMDLFIAEESIRSEMFLCGQIVRNQYIEEGKLNMKLILEKFVLHFKEIYGGSTEKFIEAHGRKFFLLYLKPIINGTGNYYIEAQTRDARRTDIIVDYLGEQFIIELKIWHGSEYNERGEKQLADYLDYYHKDKGYLLSFNFNKNKEAGVKEITIGNKTIVEAVV
ncbi:MAG: AAA-like domain-containing protein [Lachnospiraceae bacterium]|nr:AAA-like domain-containing protein [Lachnospiraceae bacterium]MDE7184821.1 AAA-like domain-containing protein [Lachnospiraceae bacterium]